MNIFQHFGNVGECITKKKGGEGHKAKGKCISLHNTALWGERVVGMLNKNHGDNYSSISL